MNTAALTIKIDAALPQTQCTRCGFPDCRSYAQAIADGGAAINRCPPGGDEGVLRLARITGLHPAPLDAAHGVEGPRRMAVIDEAWCIGCTLCLKACPVDCIVGGPKQMHTVVEDLCTGCELCLPVCPVDCISLIDVTPGRTGWDAWSPAEAQQARARHASHRARGERDARERDERLQAQARSVHGEQASAVPPGHAPAPDARRAVIDAAVARSRQLKSTPCP